MERIDVGFQGITFTSAAHGKTSTVLQKVLSQRFVDELKPKIGLLSFSIFPELHPNSDITQQEVEATSELLLSCTEEKTTIVGFQNSTMYSYLSHSPYLSSEEACQPNLKVINKLVAETIVMSSQADRQGSTGFNNSLAKFQYDYPESRLLTPFLDVIQVDCFPRSLSPQQGLFMRNRSTDLYIQPRMYGALQIIQGRKGKVKHLLGAPDPECFCQWAKYDQVLNYDYPQSSKVLTLPDDQLRVLTIGSTNTALLYFDQLADANKDLHTKMRLKESNMYRSLNICFNRPDDVEIF